MREHPSMRARTPLKFYKELSRIHNVHLASYEINASECILQSEAVITITGTTGLESIALGKKTIILGEAIYKIMNSVIKVEDIDQLSQILREDFSEKQKNDQMQDLYRFGSAIIEGSSIIDVNKIL